MQRATLREPLLGSLARLRRVYLIGGPRMWDWLSTREWATVFWLVVLVTWCLTQADIRRSLAGLLRSMLAWKIVVSYLALAGWALGWVSLASHFRLWNTGLVKDTTVWLLVYGFAALMDSSNASQEDDWFRRAALKTVGFAALMQFLLNLHTFPVLVELALQPIMTVVVVVGIVAQRDAKSRMVARLSQILLATFGLALFTWSVVEVLLAWGDADAAQTLLALAFSIWLPLVVLPFIYGIAIVGTFETLFRHLTWDRQEGLPWQVRMAVVQTLGGHLRAAAGLMRDLDSRQSVSHAVGYRGVRDALRLYLVRRRQTASL